MPSSDRPLAVRRLQYFWESGIIQRLTDDNMKDDSCSVDVRAKPGKVAFKLGALSGAFLVWGVGVACSLAAFAVEKAAAAVRSP